jgi:hypothetical protein
MYYVFDSILFSWVNPNKILDLDPRTRNAGSIAFPGSDLLSADNAGRKGNAQDGTENAATDLDKDASCESSASFGANPWDVARAEDTPDSSNSKQVDASASDDAVQN